MCKIYEFLFWIFPLRKWQAFLIEKHFARCPKCAREIRVERWIRSQYERQDWIDEEASLWPSIRQRLESREDRPPLIRPRRPKTIVFHKKRAWVAATAALLIIGFGLLVWIGHREKSVLAAGSRSEESHRIKVVSALFKGRKAKTFIYQTPSASFIWIAPAKNTGG